jgi:Xaa-Pro dipeptidase
VITANDTQVFHVIPDDFWEERGGEADFWQSEYQITEVKSEEDAWKALGTPTNAAFVGDPGASAAAHAHGIPLAHCNPEKIITALDYSRAIKTEYELACIEAANKASGPAHAAAREAFLSGATELEIHYAFLRGAGATERDLPYPTIIALNEKGSILHYQRKRNVGNGHSFLIDAGVRHNGYASDISRTYAREGAHPVFTEIIKSLNTLQLELVAAVQPDVHFIELHHQAHVGIAKILHTQGVTTADTDTAIEVGITRAFMPHGLGHMLGIQVHDVGNHSEEGFTHPLRERYPKIRTNRKLVTNMVTTIEPGIYFIDMLLAEFKTGAHTDLLNWKLIDELVPFGGVRIEDNIAVLKTGPKNFTRPYVS